MTKLARYVPIRPAVLLLGLCLSGPWAMAQDATPAKGQRMFTCGHSFHVFVYRLMDEIAKSAGIQDHQMAGLSSIGGSRVIQHWDAPDDKFKSKAALTAGAVDVLTLSPIWFPDEGIDKFAQLAFAHNPQIRIFVQEYWLPNDTYEPIYPLDTRKGADHNATDLKELRTKQGRYLHDLVEYVGALNRRLGKDVLLVVPVGQAALALREKIAAKKAPGLTMPWDLFHDCWGHAQAPLMVLSGYCHFAAIYRRSPVGLPAPSMLKTYRRVTAEVSLRKPGWRPSREEVLQSPLITQSDCNALNRLLQEVAWDTVARCPQSGLQVKSPAK